MYVKSVFVGELDWQSHENNNYCLPPTWPGFDSCIDTVCGLSLLILYSTLIDFSQATPVFPSLGKLIFLDFSWFYSYCPHSAWDFNKVIIVIVSSSDSSKSSVVVLVVIIIIIIIIIIVTIIITFSLLSILSGRMGGLHVLLCFHQTVVFSRENNKRNGWLVHLLSHFDNIEVHCCC